MSEPLTPKGQVVDLFGGPGQVVDLFGGPGQVVDLLVDQVKWWTFSVDLLVDQVKWWTSSGGPFRWTRSKPTGQRQRTGLKNGAFHGISTDLMIIFIEQMMTQCVHHCSREESSFSIENSSFSIEE